MRGIPGLEGAGGFGLPVGRGGPNGGRGGRGDNGGNNAFGPLNEREGNNRPRNRPAPEPIPHIAPAPQNDVD